MSKRVLIFCAFALALLLALPAYAAVQNIKVSGDMTVRSIVRQNYDLDKNDLGSSSGPTRGNNMDDYFMHSLGVNIMADLTDKVGVITRIINQRDWDNNSSGAATFDVDLDLGYVTLKEFFYTPLTVTVGRQDMWYGEGFIVGAKLLDFNGSITAKEYTEASAFDAIRAVFDLDPWTVDLAYAKMDENTVSKNDDVDLYICNIGKNIAWDNAKIEGYLVSKFDSGPMIADYPDGATASEVVQNTVHTVGLRGSMIVPRTILTETTIAGEIAHQSGEARLVSDKAERDRDAWAMDLSAEKKFSNVLWKPRLGLEYVLFSGESSDGPTDSGTWGAWDPVYRGKTYTAIREFQNYYYTTRFRARNVASTEVDMDSGLTNEKQLLLTGSIYPIKKLSLKATAAQFWLDEKLKESNGNTRSDNLGQEVDLLLTYDYSSDVSFNLLYGTFFPGKYWHADQSDRATDIVGTVKLTF
jgi:hypothetical protein